MLADEPTAELDERNEQIVLDALRRLRDEFGSTVVVVTHSPRVAEAVDRVVEIRDGTAAYDARPPPAATRSPRAATSTSAYGRGRRAGSRARRRRPRDRAADESLALLGRSGSGKTTLLHVLGGLVEPTAGTVEWHGRPLSSLDARRAARCRARGIAYVFQGANLLPHFTAFENVAFAAHVSREGLSARDPLELLELVGLAGEGRPPAGGALRRRGAARGDRARARPGAELLLCDEPTGHLDSDTGERVLDLIDALQAEFGFALVVATHDPDVAARLGREVELHDGAIVREERSRS